MKNHEETTIKHPLDDRPSAKRFAVGLGLVALAMALSVGTASSEEPTAASLLDGFVEAMGGKEAMEKIENRVTRGKVAMPAQGIEMDLTIYSARPNLNYTLIESDATGTIERGCDGEVVWESSAMLGSQIKEGQERTDFLRDSMFDKWLHWRELYPKVEYAGSDTVADKPVHKIVLTPEQGRPQTLFIDQDSNLAVRLDMVVENPMGTFPVVSYLTDYREIDGILIPHVVEVEVMGQKRVVRTESVEHNVELPPTRFALPPDIRSILETESAEGESKSE